MIAVAKKEEREIKFKPLGDRIVALLDEPEQESAGGIAIPESAVPSLNPHGVFTAKILAVGPGAYRPDGELFDMPLNVGDKVVFKMDNAIVLELGPHRKREGSIVVLSEQSVLVYYREDDVDQ